jgi:signal transduction histidine kinase
LDDARALLDAERVGIQIVELLGRPGHGLAAIAARQQGDVFGLQDEGLLGWVLRHDKGWFVAIMDRRSFIQWVRGFLSERLPAEIAVRITDEKGRSDGPMVGNEVMVAAMPACGLWPGWKVEFCMMPDIPSLVAARRQQGLYIWIGTLVIVLSIVAGAVTTQAVRGQARLNRLKNDFIATVAHELKTPLASMRLLVDTLLEGTVQHQEDVRQYLTLIANENLRLSGLVDKFLTFSRMERNRFAFNMGPVDPNLLVHKALDTIGPKWNHARVQIHLELQPDLPKVYADLDGMITVLVNLLDNAYKYTGDEKRITLRTSRQGDNIEISVCDNGIGIPRRALRRIFDRFYQVDMSLGRQAGGCGLGLAIVRFIVSAHKGKVIVRSRPGQGSTFTVRLPIWRPS